MNDINFTEPFRKKTGIPKMKKDNLKIDMTPMVDLGFLLVTFFVFTTEISKPAITNLYMPHDGDSSEVANSKSLTVLLANDDEVFYYFGNLEKAIKNKLVLRTSFNEITGLGSIIRQKHTELKKRNITQDELIVLIKPGSQSSYKNLVSILDEMLINNVTRYAIIDPENEEKAFQKE
jgi:biopolymer transport protein ExbD